MKKIIKIILLIFVAIGCVYFISTSNRTTTNDSNDTKISFSNVSGEIYYQVNNDDNLATISKKFNITASQIVRNNPNIDFYEGEVVKIVYETNKMHVVKPMENLEIIARKYNTTVENLIEINHLNTVRLFIGQSLIVKG